MKGPNQGSVLLVTHTRVEHLKKVLASLERSWIEEYQDLFVVIHKDQAEVEKVLASTRQLTPILIWVDRQHIVQPREAISRNIFDGLGKAFENPEIDFVTVLEDDILIREDFLKFNYEIIKLENGDERFRGINGFSGAPFEEYSDLKYGKFRFGLGWGWTITRRVWDLIRDTWSSDFESHWDALIERHIRDGYVVMPHNSRILNLGFDISGTHTSKGDIQEEKLAKSFRENYPIRNGQSFVVGNFDLNWRVDAVPYLSESLISGRVSNLAWKAFNYMSFQSGASSFEKYLKSKIRGQVLRIVRLI